MIPASDFRELHASLTRVHSALQLREAALRSAVSRLARTLQRIEAHAWRAQRLAQQSASLLVQEHKALASQLDDVLAQARLIRGLQPAERRAEAGKTEAEEQKMTEAKRAAKAVTDLSARKAAKDVPPPAKQYSRQRNAVAKHKTAGRQAKQQPKQSVVAAAQQARRPSDASATNAASIGTELPPPPHPLHSVLQRANALTQDARWRLKHSAEEATASQRRPSSTTSLGSMFALLQKQAALVCCSENSTEDQAGNGQQMRPAAERIEKEQALLEQSLQEFEALLAEVRGLGDPPSCGFTQALPPAIQLRIIQLWYDVNRSLQALQLSQPGGERCSSTTLETALTLPFPWAAQLDMQALLGLDDETLRNDVDRFYRALDASVRWHTSELVGKSLMRHVVRALRSCAEVEAAGMKTDAHAWKAPLHWYRTLCECLEDRHAPIAFTPRQRVESRPR